MHVVVVLFISSRQTVFIDLSLVRIEKLHLLTYSLCMEEPVDIHVLHTVCVWRNQLIYMFYIQSVYGGTS